MKTVIVKFTVTNPNLVSGLTRKERDENGIIERRAVSGFANQNVRPGVIDTGNHREYHNVCVASFVESLVNDGHPLTDLHYYVKSDDQGFNKKYVVVATFSLGGQRMDGSIINHLIDSAWGHCHVWFNPNDIVTVNCVHRTPPNQKPAKVNDVPALV